MKAGTTTGGIYDLADDTYQDIGHDSNTADKVIVTGKAKFYTGTLPDDFTRCNMNTLANTRRATVNQPSFWNETGTEHDLTISWNCTPGQVTWNVTTVPVTDPLHPLGQAVGAGSLGASMMLPIAAVRLRHASALLLMVIALVACTHPPVQGPPYPSAPPAAVLDRLLADYRALGLPLPPAEARLVRWDPADGSIMGPDHQGHSVVHLAFELPDIADGSRHHLLVGTEELIWTPGPDHWSLVRVEPTVEAVEGIWGKYDWPWAHGQGRFNRGWGGASQFTEPTPRWRRRSRRKRAVGTRLQSGSSSWHRRPRQATTLAMISLGGPRGKRSRCWHASPSPSRWTSRAPTGPPSRGA